MKTRKNTIRVSAIRGILLFLIPINVLLSAFSFFSWHFLRQQALDNYNSYVSVFAQQVDDHLDRLTEWISQQFYSRNDLQLIATGEGTQKFLAAKQLSDEAQTYLNTFPYEMVFFIHCDDTMHIPVATTLKSSRFNAAISDFIHAISATAQAHTMGSFFQTKIEDEWYSCFYFCRADIYCGVLIRDESLLQTLPLSEASFSSCTLTETGGTILVSTGYQSKHESNLCISLQNAPISLSFTVPKTSMFGKFYTFMVFSAVLAALAVISLCAYTIYTHRQITIPLQELKEALQKIDVNNVGQKINTAGEKEEVLQVYQTINGLIDSIVHLRLESYENKIARQRTELQYLRLQLKPHFFLNSLKRIYALSQEKQYAEIQEYLLCLADHYRFLIYDTTNTIPLQDEIQHVQNYIHLQRIGYHIPIDCKMNIAVNASALQVPPLVIQSFVENSIKYAVSPGKTLEITIQVRLLSADDGDMLNIVCADNGPGFPSGVIAAIENADMQYSKQHIGFNNLRQRMALIYKRDASLYVYNQPNGGAVVDILVPIEFPDRLPEKEHLP